MAYIGEVTARKLSIPQHLGTQLKELLKFRKLETCGDSLDSHKRSELKDRLNVDLPSVDESFILRDLVSDLETFRSGLKRRDWSRKSSEGKLTS
jgi:hypothetical protein